MGETIRGGYYRGVNGKLHDANGNPVETESESALKKAREAEPAAAESSATDPGPLGPLVPVVTAEPGTSTAEKSLAKEGVRGGKRAKAGKK